MKNIIKTQTCQTEITTNSTVVKPKRKPSNNFTRQQQIDHPLERKKSWRRRWGTTTIAERKELNAIYPGRNSITIFLPKVDITSNISLARNKNLLTSKSIILANNIANYCSDTTDEEFYGRTKFSFSPKNNNKPIFTPTKAKSMMKQTIPQPIQSIKSFKPTNAGIADLCLFDPVLIPEVDSIVLKSKPTDPFKYFVAICQKLTKERHLALFFDLKRKVTIELGVSESDVRFDATFVPERPIQTPQKREGRSEYSVKLPHELIERMKRTEVRKEQEQIERERKHAAGVICDLSNPEEATRRFAIDLPLFGFDMNRVLKAKQVEMPIQDLSQYEDDSVWEVM
jgi:flagellar basal body rod protein FlgC